MIDTNKLIPKRKEGGRSIKTIGNIELIKKDVVKIDSLLKERLVLSKVRYGILRNQNERDKRIKREGILERKKSRPQDYDANLKSNKRGRGLGGFLGGILKALLAGIGFTIFKSLPALLRIGKVIKNLITPFTLGATILIGAIASIASAGAKILPNVRGKNFEGASAKSINQGIENFKSALINTALAFAGGALGGALVTRLLRGQLFTKTESFAELEKARLKRANAFVDKVAKESGVSKRFIKKSIKSGEMEKMIDDEILRRSTKPIKKFRNLSQVKTFDDYAAYVEGQTGSGLGGANLQRLEGASGAPKPGRNIKKTRITGDVDPDIMMVPRGTSRSMDPIRRAVQVEINALRNSPTFIEDTKNIPKSRVDKELNSLLISETKRFRDMGMDKIKQTDPQTFKNIQDFKDQIELEKRAKLRRAMRQSSLSGTGLPGTAVTSSGVVGQTIFRRADGTSTMDAYEAAQKQIFGKAFRTTGEKASLGAGKKGLSKLLFNIGGEALEQTVKQTIKASVGTVPIIGDLIGFLLDVFLFGQPVGRAAFMALGSFIGSLIGGVFGLIGGPPGVLVGGILGGIGGDLLGAAFYDLIFRDNVAGRITENLTQSFTKKAVKTGVGGFLGGGFAPYGGVVHKGEFVFNEGTTDDLEKKYPGLLTALNNSRGSQVDEVLETYMSYGNECEGSERLIPLPFEKVVTRTVLVENDSEDTSSSPFMDLYRRG